MALLLVALAISAFIPQVRLRVGSHAALLALATATTLVMALAAVVFFSRFWQRRQLGAALMQERRRIAAEVHDLIMQDLSLALGTARSIADDPLQAPHASMAVAAGERALAGARQVIDGLINQDEKPIVEAVALAAKAAARHVRLSFDASSVPAQTHTDQPTCDSLIHVAREAVTNATKHSRADAVEVVLEHEDEWRLTIRDEGRGFDPLHNGDPAHGGGMGFGLQSMRERSEALGGSLRVTSTPGGGTTVEAVLP